MESLINSHIDPGVVQVVQGGVPEATKMLEQKFDIIFYTGNTHVGKVVLTAAAKHLTPCILELGIYIHAYIHTYIYTK